MLIDIQRGFTHLSTHFENYLRFIEGSNIPSTQFIYSNLSLKCFKYTNNGTQSLQLSDLVCHLYQLMRHGGGVCYKLIETDPMYIHSLIIMVVYYLSCIYIDLFLHLVMSHFKYQIII